MPGTRTAARLLALALAFAAVLALVAPEPAHALTQRDWMVALVDSLGRSFGLPDQPTPADYAGILQGRRTVRLEAEAVHAADDEVSTLAFTNFGPFSGSGWLLGTSRPSLVHLRFVLPLDGRYRLSVAARLPGHTIQAGNRSFTADGGPQLFARSDIGEVELKAGPQEITVTLPPGGALDYLELMAPHLPPIAPADGWQQDAALSWDVLALTAIQALHLETQLPGGEETLSVEAEALSGTGGARAVDDTHLGRPSGGRWLRTSAQPASVEVPLPIAKGGFYDLDLTLTGAPVGILVNDHLQHSVAGKPYLTTLTLPAVFLPRGANRLKITIPPGGGLDRVVLRSRRTDLPALASVLGLETTAPAPTSADLDRLSTRLINASR